MEILAKLQEVFRATNLLMYDVGVLAGIESLPGHEDDVSEEVADVQAD